MYTSNMSGTSPTTTGTVGSANSAVEDSTPIIASIQATINQQFMPILPLVHRVRVDTKDADEVEKILHGPLFTYWKSDVKVVHAEIKEAKLKNVLEKWGKIFPLD